MVNTTTQIPPGNRLAKQLPSLLPFDGFGGDDDVFAARDLFDFERRDSVAHNATYVCVVPIEALDLVQHNFSIYNSSIYSEAEMSATGAIRPGGWSV
jgi:hypothetical protein